jgi:hypothetical protein
MYQWTLFQCFGSCASNLLPGSESSSLEKKSAKFLMIGDVYGEKRKNFPSYKWSTYNQLLNKEVIIQKLNIG